jgi:hypothetical protein
VVELVAETSALTLDVELLSSSDNKLLLLLSVELRLSLSKRGVFPRPGSSTVPPEYASKV